MAYNSAASNKCLQFKLALFLYFIGILFSIYSLFSTQLRLFFGVIKAKQGVIQFYFRKISLHQQKFLVVSVLFNSLWLP